MFMLMELRHPRTRESGGPRNGEIRMRRDSTRGDRMNLHFSTWPNSDTYPNKDFPMSIFFSGKLVFQEENALSRFLHNHTPATLQQRLQFFRMDMMILPIRVFA